MSEQAISEQTRKGTPNAQKRIYVNAQQLPVHCPMPEDSLWNSHPKVYIPLAENKTGSVKCPYCGTEYVLSN